MAKVRASIGRLNILISATGLVIVTLWGYGADAGELDLLAGAGSEFEVLEPAYLLGADPVIYLGGERRGRALDLDTAIFTDLSPITVDENPVRLPVGQIPEE